ncbi:MAG: ABC transporter ATP-binding protein [Chloroflexi bacterium]|nr:MAG: ABC transporter ATP-binding protein [Chloroflexota bacterium]PIE80240.1 MAG: ABC transporter ATP-binding protein [Chloroflexota bacterium]
MQLTQNLNPRGHRRQKHNGRKNNNKALGRALRYISIYPKLAAGAIIALFIATAAQLAVPQLIQNMIDIITDTSANKAIMALPQSTQETLAAELGLNLQGIALSLDNALAALFWAIITIIVFAIARGLLSFAQSYLSQALSQNIAFELRQDLFNKIQRLSFSYHDKNRTGQLMIRATDDVEKLRLFIGQGMLMALQALLLLTCTLIILFLTNWRLMLVILPVLPIALIVFMVFGAVAQPLFSEAQRRLSRLNTILQENLAGLKVVKAFATEPQEKERFQESINSELKQRLKINGVFSFLFPFVFLVANLGQAAILYFGGREIISGTLTLGEWQKFSLYLIFVFIPMAQIGIIISFMAQAAASASRIFEILDTKNDVENKPNALELETMIGQVTFQDVSFRYFEGSDNVLTNLSFTAEPGQTVALLGSTGSGKSTVINLIPRFYDVSEGQIIIDGHDVRNITIESLRKHIGIVLQETTLFSGTIRDNIAYGRPDASDSEVLAAAKAAAAHEFITQFPEGYHTPVGERGSTLSGGQKQRIAIARALLMDPHILILDDSTSSVDLNTEYEIQKALDKLMEGRTSFVIAQRISTVLNADQILVLDKGTIAATGNHEELMENSPIYAEIYHSQLAEDAAIN